MPGGSDLPRIGERVRARGDHWTVTAITRHADCSSVRLTGCDGANVGRSRVLLLPFDRVHASGGEPGVRILGRRAWAHHVRAALLATHPMGGLKAAGAARLRLLPFQLEPALAMLRHGRLRVLIADEVGLGKTIQAGLVLNELAAHTDEFRAIVVTPAGIRAQWQQELESRFSLPSTLADTAWLLARGRDLPPDVNPWSLPGIYVTSLDLVKRPEVLSALEDLLWDAVVIDEAHGAGPGTARLAAAHAIGARARRVVLLTATPPYGDPPHLAAIASIGSAPGDPPPTVFRRSRQDAGIPGRRKSVFLPVCLSDAERRMHRLLEQYTRRVWREAGARHDVRARLVAVILQKRALSSAGSLARSVRRRLDLLGTDPPHDEQQLLLPLGDEEDLADYPPDGVMGVPGLSDSHRERTCLEEIATAADRAAIHESKLTTLRRLLSRVGEPVLVFTEYRDTLAQIANALANTHAPLLLHGEMSPAERAVVQRRFDVGGALLLATDAASEGLNLHQRCRLVVHFELPWTPARLEQRTGRVDRIGQQKAVHEIVLIARDTAERVVLSPLLKRMRLAAVHGDRTVSALSESAVAAALLEARTPDVDLPPQPAEATIDLHEEARCEADRLSTQRNLSLAPAGVPRAGEARAVCLTRRRFSHALVVVLVWVSDGTETIHSELVPIRIDLPSGGSGWRKQDLGEWARWFAGLHGGRLLDRARQHAGERCRQAAARWRDQALASAVRDQAVAGSLPSAAQPLVQAGLFDRRSVQQARVRRAAGERCRELIEARIAALDRLPGLAARARLIGIRLDDNTRS